MHVQFDAAGGQWSAIRFGYSLRVQPGPGLSGLPVTLHSPLMQEQSVPTRLLPASR